MNQKRAWFYFFILVVSFVGLLALFLYQSKQTSQPSTKTAGRKEISQNTLEKGRVLAACFAQGTKVLMKNFAEKNIEDIKVGDIVLTRESETSPKPVEAKVIRVLEKHPAYYLLINGQLKVTGEHVIFASGSWIYARDLRIGDYMLDPQNREIKITSIEKSKEKADVYNLEVEHYRTLFANGYYVHNIKGGFSFFIKDSQTNSVVNGAEVILKTRSPYFTSCGIDWKFEETTNEDAPQGGLYEATCQLAEGQIPPPTAVVSISKTGGYISKDATVYYGALPYGEDILIERDATPPSVPGNLRTTSVGTTQATLTWNASTDNVGVAGYKVFRNNTLIKTTSSTSYTDSSLAPATSYSYFVKSYDVNGNVSSASNTISVSTTLTIKDVGLPATFIQAGSSTTNLAAITDPKNVSNLTVEVVGKNKIVWNEAVDLSSMETANKFKALDQYIEATSVGVVEVDAKNLAELNKKTTITMFNLPFTSTPKVLVDGKENSKVVSNIAYKNSTLTFTAAHFTKFEALPTLTILEPKDGFTTKKAQISLKGKISDPTATVSATLNNKKLGDLKVATKSGEFSREITLEKGNSTILITAKGLLGATLSATVSGVFKPTVNNTTLLLILGVAVLIAALGLGGYYFYRRRVKTKPAQTQ